MDQKGLGESHRGDGVGAEPRDEEDVDDGKEGLHGHLQHHRHREQQDRAPDGPFGVVLTGSTERFTYCGPESRAFRQRVCGLKGRET